MQTKEGAKKMVANQIEKYGSVEAWRQVMRERGSKGGSHPNAGLQAGSETAKRVSEMGLEARRRKKNG